MRVLIFHGYVLRGTGSNVYNASLVQALARLGHDVDLLCQDWEADELEWVDRFVGRRGGEVKLSQPDLAPDGRGVVTVHVPDIGGLLPVYVADRYEGFEVKTFPQLTEAELARYLEANVAAVAEVASNVQVDAALANHLVMGPAILARAGLRFAAKIHGSALSYTVRPHRQRFLPLAREGMDAAAGVLVGSRHTAEDLWETIGDPELPRRTRLGPPGVDTELFAPLPHERSAEALRGLATDVKAAGSAGLGRDGPGAAAAIERLAGSDGPRVLFVGKLIVSKGVDLLLAAWPLVVRDHPGARLLLVGFGENREPTERLLAALESGDLAAAREIAARGRALEGGGEVGPLRMLDAFLASAPGSYADAARAAAGSVAFAGRLEHVEVGRLVPATDALVFPSTFPEAFGMVAAEAAAAGVFPVSADHSGMREVSRALAEAVPPEIARLLSFPLGDDAVVAIAERLSGWLGLDPDTRDRVGRALSARAGELWSWERVARGVLAASGGRLDELPRVPEA
jgi:glycosyltransferase involved in cell wall biosynthesis